MHRPMFLPIGGCLLEETNIYWSHNSTSGLTLVKTDVRHIKKWKKAVFMNYKIDFTGDADTLNVIKVEVTGHLSSDVSSAVTVSAKGDVDKMGKLQTSFQWLLPTFTDLFSVFILFIIIIRCYCSANSCMPDRCICVEQSI